MFVLDASQRRMPTKRSVAVLAHMPNATVLTSHLIAFITSRMAIVAYGEPPAAQQVIIIHPCKGTPWPEYMHLQSSTNLES